MDSKPNNTFKILFGAVVVTALLSAVLPSSKGTGTTEPSDESIPAHIQCNEFVLKQLKAPSTADFPMMDYTAVRGAGNLYIVKSYVDAQNSFGAKLRSNYLCTVKWIGIGDANDGDIRNWELVSLDIDNSL
jgi:hypothetical protein